MKTGLFLFRTAAALIATSLLHAQQPPQQPAPPLPDGYMPLAFTPHGAAPGMKVEEFSAGPRTFKISLRKGDEIMTALTEFAQKNHLRDCHFTGIGAIDSGMFGWYDPDKKADKKIVIDSEAEIVSLIGSITYNAQGKPNVHAHISVAFGDGSLKGGHLFEARISLVGQIYATDAGPSAEK
jgi:predicted DNA-binding protein with PD1-like motif